MTSAPSERDPVDTANTTASLLLDLLSREATLDDYADLLARMTAQAASSAGRDQVREHVRLALAIRERIELHQQKERGLLAVIDSAQDLTALRDVDRVLAAIVHRARQLVASDVGYLSIYDAAEGDFYVRATDGAFSERFKRIRVPGDIGICGHVARTRAPYSSTDYMTDARFSHTQGIDHGVRDEHIRAILGVPLLIGARVLGVLFVGDRYARPYSPWETSILTTLASHASVAIENARLFAENEVALAQTSAANAQLQDQAEATQFAADAHEKLTALVARGGSLHDVVAMVAALLDGSVVVLDESEQPSVWSDNAPAWDALTYAKQDRIHAALFASRSQGRSVLAYDDGGRVCRVAAITSGAGLLGGLAITTPHDLTHLETRTLERAALVAGMVLLAKERANYAGLGNRVDLLRAVFDPHREVGPTETAHLNALGLDARQPFTLAVAAVVEGDGQYVLKRLQTAMKRDATLFDFYDGHIVCLSASASTASLAHEVQTCVTLKPGLTVTCVDAAPAPLEDLPHVLASLKRCMTLLATLGRNGTAAHEAELALYARLFDGRSDDDIAGFIRATLGALAAGEATRSSDLCRTLLAYLDAGRHAGATARALDIHVNTLRQRLDAIASDLPDWQHHGRALDIHMALRLQQLRRPG
ncbi:helix-turn-helix domain-containing protein [Schauerella aestuarii]|uniref:helix-turn-helix domain-containing protein n=1 Tax=Schauerella aestuarii TaxID=2511204 RepID=UPI0013719B40|nr:GAF domain-containing protein [Achromobacter aestuarii]MYZ42378.1 GAF domain-containing protein [Achromobacter aestuarii]